MKKVFYNLAVSSALLIYMGILLLTEYTSALLLLALIQVILILIVIDSVSN